MISCLRPEMEKRDLCEGKRFGVGVMLGEIYQGDFRGGEHAVVGDCGSGKVLCWGWSVC